MRRKIPVVEGTAAVDSILRRWDEPGEPPIPRETLALAVRYLLEELAATHEGRTVEVRVPPFGAVQCVAGPRHTRGTPPNVIEMDAHTWVGLATGRDSWQDAMGEHRIEASGTRATLEGLVPLIKR